jgi:hypothetical protein
MYRRQVFLSAAAAFAIGVAFAAQPTSLGTDRPGEGAREREPWVPGANMLMSAHDATALPLAPPR